VPDLSERFNTVVNFVKKTIALELNTKLQAKYISHFIHVLDVSLHARFERNTLDFFALKTILQEVQLLNNFQSMMAVFFALSSFDVSQVKGWRFVLNNEHKILANFKELITPTNNFKDLRRQLDEAELPFLPSPALFLKDLLFIDQGNPDFVDGRVNWEKMTMISKILLQCSTAQHSHFHLTLLMPVQYFIDASARQTLAKKRPTRSMYTNTRTCTCTRDADWNLGRS
jgi:hypothetical protein